LDANPECVNQQKAYTGLDAKKYARQYYEDNKAKRLETAKQSYQRRREAILEKNKQITECGCGGRYASNNKSRHFQTKRHTDWCAMAA